MSIQTKIQETLLKTLIKSKEIAKILKAIYKETLQTKVGVSINKLSELTRIERHKLAGMIETLSALGILMMVEIGVAKVVTFQPNAFQIAGKLLSSKKFI